MTDIYELDSQSSAPLTVHPRDTVLFFRSYAHYSPAGDCWHLEIQGRVYAPPRRHLRNRALLTLLKRVVKPESHAEARQRFLERARLFLVTNQRGKSVPIAIGELGFVLPHSSGSGRFETTLTLPQNDLAPATVEDPQGRKLVRFCAHLPEKDSRNFCGEIELIAPHGVSVISDVDDTIKITNVLDRRELLANTFSREFRAVPLMADLYRRWEQAGVSFHYVSASPWPLYEPLHDWLNLDGFPKGSLHLRDMRLRELGRRHRRRTSAMAKRMVIERILRAFPQRQFILCGDSGEQDLEIYSAIARSFGSQVRHICIRQLQDSHARNGASLSQLPNNRQTRWHLFTCPEQLASLLNDLHPAV